MRSGQPVQLQRCPGSYSHRCSIASAQIQLSLINDGHSRVAILRRKCRRSCNHNPRKRKVARSRRGHRDERHPPIAINRRCGQCAGAAINWHHGDCRGYQISAPRILHVDRYEAPAHQRSCKGRCLVGLIAQIESARAHFGKSTRSRNRLEIQIKILKIIQGGGARQGGGLEIHTGQPLSQHTGTGSCGGGHIQRIGSNT